ncbi:hypothetical protein M1O12_03155 [Dehalococcoidia bacterium]|nr:hypothetical protein [Dehalococcoidia bacterium]MCL0077003.1 hypothetical protein [Dehalococcoidia bacterium]
MGLDISTFTTSPIEEPESLAAYEFAQVLAEKCECIGEGQAFGWFSKDEVMGMLDDFAMSERLTHRLKGQVRDWINSLPWDEHDCIRLYFNW